MDDLNSTPVWMLDQGLTIHLERTETDGIVNYHVRAWLDGAPIKPPASHQLTAALMRVDFSAIIAEHQRSSPAP